MAKLLLYCTKAKPYLYDDRITQGGYNAWYIKNNFQDSVNGKIVAECDFEVEEIKLLEDSNATMITNTLSEEELLKKSCLESYELCNYLYDNLWCGQKGYAIHIKNLHIFDKPRGLNSTYTNACEKCKENYEVCPICPYYYDNCRTIINAPQNMRYCYFEGNKYILISIRPEWLVRILNHEKTIEVRKKILKEMKE